MSFVVLSSFNTLAHDAIGICWLEVFFNEIKAAENCFLFLFFKITSLLVSCFNSCPGSLLFWLSVDPN